VKALATLAIEENGRITKDVVYKVVHGRFRELASLAAGAGETAWTFDFLLEELVDVFTFSASPVNIDESKRTVLTDTAVLSAKEAARYTSAINLFAMVVGLVGI